MPVESSGRKVLQRETNLVDTGSGLTTKYSSNEYKKGIYGLWGQVRTMHSENDKGGYSRLWKHGREMKDLKWLGGGNATDNILRKDVWEEEEEEEESLCEARGGEDCMAVESTQATPEGKTVSTACSDGGSVVKHLDAMFDSIMNEIFSTPDAVNGQRGNDKIGPYVRGQDSEENRKSSWKLAAAYGETESEATDDVTFEGDEMNGDAAYQKENVQELFSAGTVADAQKQGVLRVDSASPLEKIRQLEYKNMFRNPVNYKENLTAIHDIESGTAMFVPEKPPKPGNADFSTSAFCKHILIRLKKQIERHDVGRQAIKIVGHKFATVKPKIWTLLAVAYLVLIHLLLIGSKLHGL
eukprot:jgi/Picsp_1/6279/NSC_03629-R1_---NA---